MTQALSCRIARFIRPACVLAALAGCVPAAGAITVQIRLTDQQGHVVSNAAVYAMPVNGKLPVPHPGTAVIDQIHREFVPLVSIIQTGTSVSFPNLDNIEHDVYSFSPAKTFELDLYSGVPSHPVVFDKPGLVVLGFNVHDSMLAYVYVVDTPYIAKSDASGIARIDNLPPGNYEFKVWHYQPADPATLPEQRIVLGADASLNIGMPLKPQ